MSSHLKPSLVADQKTYACTEESFGSVADSDAFTGRDLFTQQTGKLLLTLGHMLMNLPAFNAHIQPSTGQRLISLGNKLSVRK